MKTLIQTRLFDFLYLKNCNELSFEKVRVLIDDFADAIVNLSETQTCNIIILRTLNYTKTQLQTMKSLNPYFEKKMP